MWCLGWAWDTRLGLGAGTPFLQLQALLETLPASWVQFSQHFLILPILQGKPLQAGMLLRIMAKLQVFFFFFFVVDGKKCVKLKVSLIPNAMAQ